MRPIWPKMKLVQDFMLFLVTHKTEKDQIKTEMCYRVHNLFSIISLWEKISTLKGE